MKKTYFLILMLLFVCINGQAYCAKHSKKTHENTKTTKHSKKTQGIEQQISLLRYEIEAMENGTSKENIQRLSIWLNTLEAKILSKLKHAEARLEKHIKTLNLTEETHDSSKGLEKIRSSENRIKTCQELLIILEQLKTKLGNKA